MTRDSDSVRRHLMVDAAPAEAFRRFTEDMHDWWPKEFTFGGRVAAIEMEPRRGGRLFERGEDGREVDWGEVRVWQPPERVVLSWRVAADRSQEPPERASEVEVLFVEREPGRTVVEIEHRDLNRHGDGADTLREGMGGPDGWQRLLEAFGEAYDTGGAPSDEALT